MKKYVMLFLLLSACSASGQAYSSLPVHEPARGMVELVIYHPSEIYGIIAVNGSNVKINGKIACSLANGSYFIDSAAPGAIHISSTHILSVGTSFLDIKTAANKRYFIKITWNNTKAMGGAIGELLTNGSGYRSGPFVIELVDEKSAVEELGSLKMAGQCS